MRRGIWHLADGNASSAVCSARVNGETIRTSGTGCSCSALDCACSACLIPSGVSFVSYLQQMSTAHQHIRKVANPYMLRAVCEQAGPLSVHKHTNSGVCKKPVKYDFQHGWRIGTRVMRIWQRQLT